MERDFFSLPQEIVRLGARAEEQASPYFKEVLDTAAYNSQKVLAAFQQNCVSDTHFVGTTGYGYDDRGRDTLDRVYADAFGAEDALVRHFMLSGTHAITTALFGVLRPGDEMVSVTGKPYDTMDGIIGLTGEGMGSLREFGVRYRQVELGADGRVDLTAIGEAAKSRPKMIYIQRSRGYAVRPTVTVEEISVICQKVKAESPETIVMVDNCYGEFVERREPVEVGADLMAGSLIKNPGGSMAECGGYIAGRAELVRQCAYRLNCPGIGRKAGPSLNENRNMYRGFFFAPHIVGQALKTAIFAASLFELLGFQCTPRYDEPRSDIIQSVITESPEALCAFCQGIQKGSPIDAFVCPEPWAMPGYDDEVIMAAGAFVQGASIELSADGPMRAPYTAFLQGGVIYDTAKIGVLQAAKLMLERGLVTVPNL